MNRAQATVDLLEPLNLDPEGSGTYDERWLQDLLLHHPNLIPADEVEPVFSGAVAVCRELPTRVGPLDLVYVNEHGLLTLVECKLWRNPEARRHVVGQILDYAQEIVGGPMKSWIKRSYARNLKRAKPMGDSKAKFPHRR